MSESLLPWQVWVAFTPTAALKSRAPGPDAPPTRGCAAAEGEGDCENKENPSHLHRLEPAHRRRVAEARRLPCKEYLVRAVHLGPAVLVHGLALGLAHPAENTQPRRKLLKS